MKILLVDDDIGILNALKAGLVSFGHQVMIAKRAHQALQIINNSTIRSDVIDLLVTDLRIPDMNGLELIRSARRTRPTLKALLITAYGNDEIRESVKILGSCKYLEKPFSPESVKELIKNLPEGDKDNERRDCQNRPDC